MKPEKKAIKAVVKNKLGLHARAAASLVQLTNKFVSNVSIEKNGQVVNGKSIMGVMMLAAAKGHEIVITAEGEDADDALEKINNLIENKFGEE